MTAHERFVAVMNSGTPNLDNVVNVDVIGAYGLEWDGDRCQGEDCRRPVDDDVKLCDDCQDAGGEACVRDASCEPGDHTLSWPCDYAPGTGARASDGAS